MIPQKKRGMTYMLGAIEAGSTKFVVAIGDQSGRIIESKPSG